VTFPIAAGTKITVSTGTPLAATLPGSRSIVHTRTVYYE